MPSEIVPRLFDAYLDAAEQYDLALRRYWPSISRPNARMDLDALRQRWDGAFYDLLPFLSQATRLKVAELHPTEGEFPLGGPAPEDCLTIAARLRTVTDIIIADLQVSVSEARRASAVAVEDLSKQLRTLAWAVEDATRTEPRRRRFTENALAALSPVARRRKGRRAGSKSRKRPASGRILTQGEPSLLPVKHRPYSMQEKCAVLAAVHDAFAAGTTPLLPPDSMPAAVEISAAKEWPSKIQHARQGGPAIRELVEIDAMLSGEPAEDRWGPEALDGFLRDVEADLAANTVEAEREIPPGHWPRFPFDPQKTETVPRDEAVVGAICKVIVDWDGENWEAVRATLREHGLPLEEIAAMDVNAIRQRFAVGWKRMTLSLGGQPHTHNGTIIAPEQRDATIQVPTAVHDDRGMLTISRAAKILCVQDGTVCRWADKGKLVDNGKQQKQRRVTLESVNKLADARRSKPSGESTEAAKNSMRRAGFTE